MPDSSSVPDAVPPYNYSSMKNNVSIPSNGAPPDISSILPAVGTHILSFLPLGCLLNGRNSPLLVSKLFRYTVYVAIADRESLDFSRCQHLRKITDHGFMHLVRNLLVLSEICRPEFKKRARENKRGSFHTRLKFKYIDLSRCRKFRGNGLKWVLPFVPNLQRLSLASCTKFEPKEAGLTDKCLLNTKKLHHLDVSGSKLLTAVEVKHFLSVIRGSNITHLDLSGCSPQINDNIILALAPQAPNLENVNLSKCKKLSEFGVGVLAWLCRSTLKGLRIRDCPDVKLPRLLYGECWKIKNMLEKDDPDPRIFSPVNLADKNNPLVGTEDYCEELLKACLEMVSSHGDNIHDASEKMLRTIKKIGKGEDTLELFGKLEVLDISMIGNSRSTFEGCIATIAWLNGGHLREVYTFGLSSLSIYDITVLHRTCGPRLQVAEYDVSNGPLSNDTPDLMWGRGLRELNISHCGGLIHDGNVFFLAKLHNLAVLKMDFLEFDQEGLHNYLLIATRLKKLSLFGCHSVTCTRLCNSLSRNQELKLLYLDARGVRMDCSMKCLEDVVGDLIELNNWSTDLGKASVREHIRYERMCSGSRASSITPYVGTKRLRDGKQISGLPSCAYVRDRNTMSRNGVRSAGTVCTLRHTGFLQWNYTEQELFVCKTCKIDFGNAVCATCVKFCHVDHETVSAGYKLGSCRCCVLGECLCLE